MILEERLLEVQRLQEEPQLLPMLEGRGKPKAGSALSAANVCNSALQLSFLNYSTAYTSMLRLTTSAPTPSELKGEGSGSEDEGGPIVIPDAAAATTTEVRSGGLLGATLRPGFLRGLSFRSGPAPANDVESQAGLGRTGA